MKIDEQLNRLWLKLKPMVKKNLLSGHQFEVSIIGTQSKIIKLKEHKKHKGIIHGQEERFE